MRLIGYKGPVERRNPDQVTEVPDSTIACIDCGGANSAHRRCFDHHQRGGAGTRWDSDVPYAAFGLVYDWVMPSHPMVAQWFHDHVVAPVDAADCGYGEPGTRPELSFSRCVSMFNPSGEASPEERDAAFWRAVEFAKQVLQNGLEEAKEFAAAWEAVMEAETAHDGQVLVLERFIPWNEHIFGRKDQANLLYVVFPSERGGWMVQQVPVAAGSFDGRKPLPEAWAGLRDQQLRDVTGILDATFCHPGRFCGGAESRDGTLSLAALAIALS
jgi:uncharacterized UPF0160 family protein